MNKRVWIDPRKIEHMIVPRFQKSLPFYGYHIRGGDWDKRTSEIQLDGTSSWSGRRTRIPISNYDLYQSMVERYQHEVPWEETDFFRRKVRESTGNPRTDEKDITERLKKIDALYESIRTDGYKTQSQLGRDSGYRLKTSGFHEVLVNIGRDGALHFDDGRHRLFVAKILGLEAIPVRIFVRHEAWQSKRQKLNDGDEALKKYSDHPDIVGDTSIQI